MCKGHGLGHHGSAFNTTGGGFVVMIGVCRAGGCDSQCGGGIVSGTQLRDISVIHDVSINDWVVSIQHTVAIPVLERTSPDKGKRCQ